LKLKAILGLSTASTGEVSGSDVNAVPDGEEANDAPEPSDERITGGLVEECDQPADDDEDGATKERRSVVPLHDWLYFPHQASFLRANQRPVQA